MEKKDHSCFFTKNNNPQRVQVDRDSINYFSETHSSSLLEVSNKTGSMFLLNQKKLCFVEQELVQWMLTGGETRSKYQRFELDVDEDLMMTKLSPCETLIAIANSSNLIIIHLPSVLIQRHLKVIVHFAEKEHNYTYIEWSPLNDIYSAEPYLLMLGCSGRLRVSWIYTQKMYINLDEEFHCATFSLDGGFIYAINYDQELCILDPLSVKVLSKRKIDEFGNISHMIPTQMMQLTSEIMVIGSICKDPEGQIENSTPYLLVLCGDLLDAQSKLSFTPFQMSLSPEKMPDFRFHYVKERQLLFFSHSESSSVQVLQFDENGKPAELDSLDLDETKKVRGFVFYQGRLPMEEKDQMIEVEHQAENYTLPCGPRLLILDSEGFMHHFNYYDTRYPLPSQSMLVEMIGFDVLGGIRPVPTVLANRSMITADPYRYVFPTNSFQRIKIVQGQEGSENGSKSIFKYQGYSKSIGNWSYGNSNNPYMLDCINEIGLVLAGYGKRRGVAHISKLDWMVESKIKEFGFYEYQAQEEDRGNIKMLRVSDCKYLVAMMYESTIEIQETNTFLEGNFRNQQERKFEAEFALAEGAKFSFIEWPPLNHSYIEKPYFLTRDDQGILRVHYVEECKEEIVGDGEVFRCGTFSLDGRWVYAINEKQEICQIDLQDSKIIMRRKIFNTEEIISSHIQQVTPGVFAIGSMIKTKVENPENEKDFRPYLHIFCGDISNPKAEIKMNLYEMPFLKAAEQKKSLMFRSLFVKERQLLFFGHNGSNEIRVLHFGHDGSQIEIDRLTLGDLTLRGMVFVKEAGPINKHQVLISLKHPELLALDSKGYLHHFHYFDADSSVPILPKFKHLLSTNEFLKKRELLKEKLSAKKKSRGKSQAQKRKTPNIQKKKRSKSRMRRALLPEEIKALREEIQKRIEARKNKEAPIAPLKIPENPFLSIKKNIEVNGANFPENPFLSFKKTENTLSSNLAGNQKKTELSENKPIENPFLSVKKNNNAFSENPFLSFKKTENIALSNVEQNQKKIELNTNEKVSGAPWKSVENPFLSFKNTGSTALSSTEEKDNKKNLFAGNNTSLSNLFSADISKNNLFAPVSSFKKESETEAKELFSAKSKSKVRHLTFDCSPKAGKFLNKLESDITLKVEDQEFPAHNSILSERCKFFKNMFASGMSESYSTIIEIPDIKAPVFKAFLSYVYLGTIEVDEELAFDLYELSEKYTFDELKKACENFLASIVTLENFFRIFQLADLYETESLKLICLDFFRSNIEKILERKDFEELPKMSYIHLKRMQWEMNEITF